MDISAELKYYEQALNFENSKDYCFYMSLSESFKLTTEKRLNTLKNLDKKLNFVAAYNAAQALNRLQLNADVTGPAHHDH
jgi:hypothetical protein